MNLTRWRALSYGLLLALVAALGVLAFVLASDDGAADRVSAVGGATGDPATLLAAEVDAERAARDAAVHLTSYDYRSLDTDFDWVVTAGTEAFRARYAEVSEPTKKYVAEFRVRAEGSVEESAATAQDPDHVTVLLFVDQELTSDADDARRLATPRVRMSMVRSGTRWLVDDVAVLDLVDR